ncbi:MAG TPA: hypothetical protein VK466_14745 [Terriglobales bacterium]|nr:hypothetical protein [Terriglobales bacterium]
MTFLRMIAPKTLLFAMLALPSLIMNAYAQQEVDPTWYDPWAATKPAAAQMKAEKKPAQKVKTAAKRTAAKPAQLRAAQRSEQGRVMVAAR